MSPSEIGPEASCSIVDACAPTTNSLSTKTGSSPHWTAHALFRRFLIGHNYHQNQYIGILVLSVELMIAFNLQKEAQSLKQKKKKRKKSGQLVGKSSPTPPKVRRRKIELGWAI